MDATALLNISAILLAFAALFGWINTKFLKLPMTIGLVLISLAASMGVVGLDAVFELGYAEVARGALNTIDFHDSLMIGMLHLLLFAGALHTDLDNLLVYKWHILLMATLGVVISTAIIGFITYYLVSFFGFDVPLIWCLVFGSLISPTDPVAVLSIIRTLDVPKNLQTKIAGESLFNDGIGVVVFLALVGVATGGSGHGVAEVAIDGIDVAHSAAASTGGFDPSAIAKLLFQEVVVGVVIGLLAGYITFLAMRSIDDYVVEVIMSLALVMGIYALCSFVHASGPLGVVVAGLFIGNHGTRFAMSRVTQEHLEKFWELIDEILNAVLFLLIGFEILVIPFSENLVWLVLAILPVVLIGRTLAVSVPTGLIRSRGGFVEKGAVPVLIWGGLRGGISVALALSLPEFDGKSAILAMTYGVVIFSIVIQGLTVQRVIAKFVQPSDRE